MKKKILATLLVTTLCVATLFGCGKKENGGQALPEAAVVPLGALLEAQRPPVI